MSQKNVTPARTADVKIVSVLGSWEFPTNPAAFGYYLMMFSASRSKSCSGVTSSSKK
jgi:hypothetical protein